MHCKCQIEEIPSVRNAMQHCETEHKTLSSNYESPALTAELQTRRAATREHRTFNVQPPIFSVRSGVAFTAELLTHKTQASRLSGLEAPISNVPAGSRHSRAVLLGRKNRRQSVRDERISHYDSDGNVIDPIGQLRFGLACLIDVHHGSRLRIILKRSQTDAEHSWSRHQIVPILFQCSACAIEGLLRKLK